MTPLVWSREGHTEIVIATWKTLAAFDEFCRLMGFERVWQFDREHAETT